MSNILKNLINNVYKSEGKLGEGIATWPRWKESSCQLETTYGSKAMLLQQMGWKTHLLSNHSWQVLLLEGDEQIAETYEKPEDN